MYKSNVNYFYKKTDFDNFESDLLTKRNFHYFNLCPKIINIIIKVDRIKNKRDVVETSPNYRCETGSIESFHNYKINPTLDSLKDDKFYTYNNLDFSNFGLSKNNFSNKYSNVLNEFSPSLNKNTTLESNKRLNLLRIPSKLESHYRVASPKFSNKVQDFKYTYLTQENHEYNFNKSPLRTMSNLNTGCNN